MPISSFLSFCFSHVFLWAVKGLVCVVLCFLSLILFVFNVTWSRSFQTDACMLMPLNFWPEMSGCLTMNMNFNKWTSQWIFCLVWSFSHLYWELHTFKRTTSTMKRVKKGWEESVTDDGSSRDQPFCCGVTAVCLTLLMIPGGKSVQSRNGFSPAVVMSDQRRRFTRLQICSTLPLMLFFLFPSSAQMCLTTFFPCPVLCSCGLCVY